MALEFACVPWSLVTLQHFFGVTSWKCNNIEEHAVFSPETQRFIFVL